MPVYRIEVRAVHAGDDPTGAGVLAEIRQMGMEEVREVRASRIFLLQAEEGVLDAGRLEKIAREVLIDPVTETFSIEGKGERGKGEVAVIEVHLKPGVMDPVAASCEMAIGDLLGEVSVASGQWSVASGADAATGRHGDTADGARAPQETGNWKLETGNFRHSALSTQSSALVRVRTGKKYELLGHVHDDLLRVIARRVLVNESIETGYFEAFTPAEFPSGHPYVFKLAHVPVRELSDEQLMELSRRGHLFLDKPEMRAIQGYFQELGRDPTDAEIETLAQTWSEHCVHKTLKARVEITQYPSAKNGEGNPPEIENQKSKIKNPPPAAPTVTVFENLIKETIFRATMELNKPWTLSVFKDNAGVIALDDQHAVCMKVETHNRPSAIEPYGGAATGIGGCIRDVIGTGLGAKPIASTDIFCFADPETPAETLPAGVIHPRRSMQRVVAGVRDYGNRMGIPTVNGAVFFHERYIGNPLVFCGTVGLLPRKFAEKGHAKPGDHILLIGGRTGRDGIHGATFSSDVVTATHADEFSHAVQIGNAITEKKMLDVILQARDYEWPVGSGQSAEGTHEVDPASDKSPGHRSLATDHFSPLFHAITDCGAGGLSSAVGEMGEHTGATVELHKVPLKYAGLSYAEIWISEAQERMVLAVPPENVRVLLDLCAGEDVEGTDIGVFDGSGKLTLHFAEAAGDGEGAQAGTGQVHTVAEMDMAFIHDGIPKPERKAIWKPPELIEPYVKPPADFAAELHALLAMPSIASKHWIIRQYDHEVQGGTVIKPLVGPGRDGPGDASVIRPLLGKQEAVVLGVGCQLRFGDIDPYQMALNGLDEAVRNIVCAGGDPERTAVLDNFCWPKCSDPKNLGALVKACQACYDGAIAYGTPFISGKDSLSNEFIASTGERIQIPYTLLISAISIIPDARRAITMDVKGARGGAGSLLVLVGLTGRELGGSHYFARRNLIGASVPRVDLAAGPAIARAVAGLIQNGWVAAAHDLSEGGLAVAVAEMLFSGDGQTGATVDLAGVPCAEDADDDAVLLFSESPSRYLLEIRPEHFDALARTLKEKQVRFGVIGRTDSPPPAAGGAGHAGAGGRLKIRSAKGRMLMDEPLAGLKKSWLATLDW